MSAKYKQGTAKYPLKSPVKLILKSTQNYIGNYQKNFENQTGNAQKNV